MDLSKETVADLKEVFMLFDKDEDGVLSFPELEVVMKNLGQRPSGQASFGSTFPLLLFSSPFPSLTHILSLFYSSSPLPLLICSLSSSPSTNLPLTLPLPSLCRQSPSCWGW